MAQHFLLSAAARTLSLKEIYAGGEEAAYQRFCRLRWPHTAGAPVCSRCGGSDVNGANKSSRSGAVKTNHCRHRHQWTRDEVAGGDEAHVH